MLFSKKNKLSLVFLLFFSSVFAQTLPTKNITISDGLPSNSIKCFYKDSNGLMWIGTDSGLCCYDGKNYKIYNEANGLKHSQIWAITEDDDKNLWISLYGNGLAKFNGKKFTYFDKNDGLIHNYIRKIHYSKKYKCLILGTENGLSLFDGEKFKSFVLKTIINHFQIASINETTDKIYFTVSYDNVYSININSDILNSSIKKEFTPPPSYSSFINGSDFYSGIEVFNKRNLKTGKETTYKSPIIWDYAIDNKENIYCATWNVNSPKGGLFQYSNNKLKNITKNTGITSTELWCLYFDELAQQLWVGSNDKGIFIVDLSEKFNFILPEFFNQNQLEIQCLYKDSNDNIWIGATDKIIIYKPDKSYEIINRTTLWEKLDKFWGLELNKDKDLKYYYDYHRQKNNFTCFKIVEDQKRNIWLTTTAGYLCLDNNKKLLHHRFSEGGQIVFNDAMEVTEGVNQYEYVF